MQGANTAFALLAFLLLGCSRGSLDHPTKAAPESVAVKTTVVATPPKPPTVSVEDRIGKSIQDNKSASSRGVNLDGLRVHLDPNTGRLDVSILRETPSRATEVLDNGSALAIVVGRAVWRTYPDITSISIAVNARPKNSPSGSPTTPVYAIYEKTPWLEKDYSQLSKSVADDNKTMLCDASFYAIDRALWASLIDPGCMLANEGGSNVAIGGRTYAVKTSTGPIALRDQRQVDVVSYVTRFRAISGPADQNVDSFKQVMANADRTTTASLYNFLLTVKDANESLALAALDLQPPPGFADSSDELRYAFHSRSDALKHLANFLNRGDLEEQRQAMLKLQDADRSVVAAVANLFANVHKAGLRPDKVWDLVVCDSKAKKCQLVSPTDPQSIFN